MEINPEQERQRLTERYAEMPLEKLQKIAADWGELTEIARNTIEAEIRRRGSSVPDSVKTTKPPVVAQPEPVVEIPAPEEPEEDEPPVAMEPDNSSGAKLVLVRSFRDLPEALLAKGSLDSAGIETFLADDNIVRMDWFWSNVIGGVKLMVSPEDFDEATAILDQPIPENIEVEGVGEYQQPRCPKCSSFDIAYEKLNEAIAYGSAGFLMLPLPVHNSGWSCHACGNKWDAPADEAPAAEQQ